MKTDRLIAIVMVLLNYEKVSAARLAEMFEVSTRTIYRDVESLELAGIPITVTTGSKGGIGIMPQYKVDKRFFTAADVQALVTGLNSASAALSRSEINGIIEKVKSLLPKDRVREIEFRSNQIAIDLSPWIGVRNFQDYIEKIKEAFAGSRYLLFDYTSKGKTSKRHVEPYRLVSKAGYWYLQGYCTMRGDYRVFKLSRMSDLRVAEESFSPRDFEPAPLGGDPRLREMLIRVRIRVESSLREQLTDLFGDLDFNLLDGGGYITDIPFMEDDYSYNILLGLGVGCECLGPPHVRAELIKRLEKMVRIYSPDSSSAF